MLPDTVILPLPSAIVAELKAIVVKNSTANKFLISIIEPIVENNSTKCAWL
jgi:hypothetical protein